MEHETRQSVLHRIEQRGRTEHSDFFDYILPADSPVPTTTPELLHIGSVSLQFMFASWGPMADLFYGTLALLVHDSGSYGHLVQEIRTQFTQYEDITSGRIPSLPFLHACLEETLRLLPSNRTGLPRISPGAMVDGRYIAKRVSTSTPYTSPTTFKRFYANKSLGGERLPTRMFFYRLTYNPACGLWPVIRSTLTKHSNSSPSDGYQRITRFTTRHSSMII